MTQPTVGPLEVIDGLGRGHHARISADYEMMTPEMVGHCFGLVCAPASDGSAVRPSNDRGAQLTRAPSSAISSTPSSHGV